MDSNHEPLFRFVKRYIQRLRGEIPYLPRTTQFCQSEAHKMIIFIIKSHNYQP